MNRLTVEEKIRQIMKERKGEVTPEYIFRQLHYAGYKATEAAPPIKTMFPDLTAVSMCALISDEYNDPFISKEEVRQALDSCGYPEQEIEEAIKEAYPAVPKRYAVVVGGGFLYAPSHRAYNFGTNDFSIDMWIKTTKTGTVFSRKGAAGGAGNGGFLLVIKRDGSIKLATDDGFGFYEVNSEPTAIMDGTWRHLLGVRESGDLKLYLDFKRLATQPRTDRHRGLNVSNCQRVMIGQTDQYQEEFNEFIGEIGETRIWSVAKFYKDKEQWQEEELNDSLVGRWSFSGKDGHDSSQFRNDMKTDGMVTFQEWLLL